MTYFGIYALSLPIIATALVAIFARVLANRTLAAYFRSEAMKREVRLREAAE